MLQSSAAPSTSAMRARHIERHGGGGALSDVILGGQDGLVNVLGVILGIAAATPDPNIVLAGGLADTFAESISMGAVAYTSTLADRDFYLAELEREKREIRELPDVERDEVRTVYRFTHSADSVRLGAVGSAVAPRSDHGVAWRFGAGTVSRRHVQGAHHGWKTWSQRLADGCDRHGLGIGRLCDWHTVWRQEHVACVSSSQALER